MKKILLFIVALLWAGSSWGQVNLYPFASSTGSYTEITGGTVLGTTANDDQRFVDPAVPAGGTTLTGVGFPIGFNFTYDFLVFDRLAINTNGWISLGQSSLTPSVNNASSSAYLPIGSVTAITPALLVSRISGFGRDLQGQTGSELRIETVGSTPNRECVIQWKGYKKYGTSGTGDNYNFQIRLVETTNQIKIVYGVVTNGATSNTIQVGLRGAPATTATNFANRTTTTDWASTTAGTLNTASCAISSTVYPAYGLTFVYSPPPPCSGIPAPGNTLTSDNPVCSGINFTLSLQNNTPGTGVTYQWQSSLTGADPWTNVGTSASTYTTSQTASTYYRCQVTCSGNTSISNPIQVVQTTFCYCASAATSNGDEDITSVIFGSTLNNTTPCASLVGSQGTGTGTANLYSNFIYSVTPTDIPQGVSVPLNVTITECAGNPYTHTVKVYIDFNQNLLLTDAGESFTIFNNINSNTHTITTTIPIPLTATLGNTLMRIVCKESPSTFGPCDLGSYGETEDYKVNITAPPACMPPAGLTTSNITTTTADLNWINGGSETTWDVIYGPLGFDPLTQGTLISGITAHPYTLNPPLNPANLYSCYVRANCDGPSPLSSWAGPVTFQTLCVDNTTYPLAESFDGTSFPPICWDTSLMVIGTGSGTLYGNWGRVISGTSPTCTNHSGAGMVRFNSFSFKAGTKSILVSPALNLPGENYMVKFWMFRDNGYPTLYDQVNVYYNTSPTSSGGTLIGTVNRYFLFSPAELLGNLWYPYEFALPAGSGGGGGRYVIFEGVSAYGNNIFLDDVEIASSSSLTGYVYDYNGNPVVGATVEKVGGLSTNSGGDGSYQLIPLSGGSYQFKCSKTGYNYELATIDIPLYSEATHDFTLLNPEMAVSPGSLFAILSPTETETDNLVITNAGNGTLGWQASISYGTSLAPGVVYCPASHPACSHPNNEWIARVVLNTIDNSSECESYSDFTGISTSLNQGDSYTIALTIGNPDPQDLVRAWIDWNQDGQFDEAPIIFTGTLPNLTGNFTVPNDAVKGSTRIRIRLSWQLIPVPCGEQAGGWGEVEDYTINVGGWLSLDNYSGAVLPFGETQTVAVAIDASETPPSLAPGVTYNADILFTSPSGIESVTVPVTLIVTDGSLKGPVELTLFIVNEQEGKFMLKWKYFTIRGMTFDHFVILRNGEMHGTSVVSSFNEIITAPGTYCYKVYAVYQGEVYSEPSNEACLTYPLAPGVPLANWAIILGALLIGTYALIMIRRRA